MTNPSCVHLFTDYIESPLIGQQSYTQYLIKIIHHPPEQTIEKHDAVVMSYIYYNSTTIQEPHTQCVPLDPLFSRWRKKNNCRPSTQPAKVIHGPERGNFAKPATNSPCSNFHS